MNKRKILIIEDDIDLVEALRIVLEKEGYEVIDAQEGEKGYELVVKEKPDLVILDVMMGTQDEGFHVAYRIRQNREVGEVPIIMLTAIGQETGFKFDKEKDEDFLPVEEFVEKPVTPARLVDLVRKHLGS
ncbi:MAG: response regulator [Candidatus Neomarinimicrobiota bacterium]|nr:response regulator [Candidatus Neomarinimicrobiota bacterium]RLF44170.1 MAG: response regulator [Thermoplasmata archaeon]MCD6100269.1 response regulator [Candidatus Neomarinimicrobiota bacterium]RKY48423.1 MAG: response regulator [Candidatus Neomarinimicrobiota bacterium]RKY48908.1 MAG: response regulator [Candidatus Neomarinimicrobiota bacterium]